MKAPNRYVALDVETTGLSPKNGDRVIEIGAVAIEDRCIVAEFSSLIDVDKMIPWQVQQVHGITNEMLEGEPKSDEVLPKFYKFIAGSILVAHNASFDIRFLRHIKTYLTLLLYESFITILRRAKRLASSKFPA